jgi:hypothetical protein
MVLIILFVVAVVISAIFLVFVTSQSTSVSVNAINIWAPDNVCGLNSNPIYYDGYSGSTGDVNQLTFPMPNFNTTACTIVSVVTNTSGFSLSGIQVPITIPGNSTGTNMDITITSPGSSFSGNLDLVLH